MKRINRGLRPTLLMPALLLLAGLTGLGMPGCSSQSAAEKIPIREQIKGPDRAMDWGLIYYQSWLRDRNATYLELSQKHMAQAVAAYYEIQLHMGYGYPDFYIVDKRRRRGCQYLFEIADIAAKRSHPLPDHSTGCF
ncbi:MAG: hypothetical protein OEW12_04525 [Deltaproteobacteria bacterium]|nr:hypothetical protein [Deltaproteobacteria bacterium]